jgi:hypothetical protein
MKRPFYIIGLALVCSLFSCEKEQDEQKLAQIKNNEDIQYVDDTNADELLILTDEEFGNSQKSTRGNLTYEAENSPMQHLIGFSNDGAWCSATYNGSGFMLYGPYTNKIPAGQRNVTVRFRIKIDNNTANNDVVCQLDACSNTGSNILKQVSIRRKNMSTSYQWIGFTFDNNSGNNNLEFRINTKGNSMLFVDKVNISW